MHKKMAIPTSSGVAVMVSSTSSSHNSQRDSPPGSLSKSVDFGKNPAGHQIVRHVSCTKLRKCYQNGKSSAGSSATLPSCTGAGAGAEFASAGCGFEGAGDDKFGLLETAISSCGVGK